MSIVGHLFQAAMWRRLAMDWDLPDWHWDRHWVEEVLRVPRDECLRRSKANALLARAKNQSTPTAIP